MKGRGRKTYKHVRILSAGTERNHHVIFPVSRALGERLTGRRQKPPGKTDSPDTRNSTQEGADVDSD